jgi:hypothetical protein
MSPYFPRYVAAQENDTYTLFALKTLMHQAAQVQFSVFPVTRRVDCRELRKNT